MSYFAIVWSPEYLSKKNFRKSVDSSNFPSVETNFTYRAHQAIRRAITKHSTILDSKKARGTRKSTETTTQATATPNDFKVAPP